MRTAVIGLGDRDRGDGAAGLLVADELSLHDVPADVLAWERPELDLLEVLPRYDRVVLVDAARSDVLPGTIHRDPHLDPHAAGLETHGFGLGEVLELATALGRLPDELELLLIETGPATHGARLSLDVAIAVDRVIVELLRTLTEGDADVSR